MCSRIYHHVGSIPCQGAARINICHFRNIHVDKNLDIKINIKNLDSPDYVDYNEYKTFLTSRLQILAQNAADESRKIKYEPLSTISTGYDSPACSVIAKSVGCKEAVTFRDARGEEHTKGTDSGKSIGDILGYSVKEFDRNLYLKKSGLPEAEFVASGDMGQDFELCAFEEEWRQRLVLVGNSGWYAWNRFHTRDALNIPLYRNDFEGDSWIDFKFRVGFVACNLPFIGALNRKSLYKITHSAEMKPYWLGTLYDRPIARRLVEEAGVPRALFGQRKKAASVLLNRDKNLLKYMNSESFESFERNYQKYYSKERNQITQFFYNSMFALYQFSARIGSKFEGIFHRLNLNLEIPQLISIKYSESPGKPSFLVHWGIENIKSRYEFPSE
jgi:hypothetical protein